MGSNWVIDMVMPGILGTVSDGNTSSGGGGGGGGSTDPSIATSASGNYDQAFTLSTYVSTSHQLGVCDYGGAFSSGSASTNFEIEGAENISGSNNCQLRIFGYIREGSSGTSSPTWTLHTLALEDTNGILGQLSGGANATLVTSSYNQYQDNTLSTRGYAGIGAYVKIDAGGGRGGLNWGSNGDEISFEVKASIDGDQTESLDMTVNWVG